MNENYLTRCRIGNALRMYDISEKTPEARRGQDYTQVIIRARRLPGVNSGDLWFRLILDNGAAVVMTPAP